MEIVLSLNITKLAVKTTITYKPIKENTIAFVEMHYYHNSNGKEEILFKVKGYTIKIKQFKNEEPFYKVDAPAYWSKAKKAYRASFYVNDKKIWKKIEKKILEEFNEKIGGVSAGDYKTYLMDKNEEVNPNDIPL